MSVYSDCQLINHFIMRNQDGIIGRLCSVRSQFVMSYMFEKGNNDSLLLGGQLDFKSQSAITMN